MQVCRVNNDLVVFPESLHKLSNLLIVGHVRNPSHDIADRAFAVDFRKNPRLCRIDWKSEVRMDMRPIDEDGRRTGWHPIVNTDNPGQWERNVVPPGITAKGDWLTFDWAIIAVGDEAVLGYGPAQKLDRCVLQWRGKRGKTLAMRRRCDHSAPRQIGGLFVPTRE